MAKPKKTKPAPELKAPEREALAHRAVMTALTDLKPHPRNYKTHPEEQLAHLRQSLREHGFYRNVVAARDLTILAGHGVVEAARAEGYAEVPVVRLDVDPLDPRALKLLAADNELPKFAETDDRALTELLRDVSKEGDGLLGTGFDEQMLAALVMNTRPASEIRTFDAAAEWSGSGMPAFDPGDRIFRLIVQFKKEEDREKFVSVHAIQVTSKVTEGSVTGTGGGKTWSGWWPSRPRDDLASLRWKEKSAEGPK